MLPPATKSKVVFPADERPYLLVVIDAEEEFDWSTFSSDATGVANMRHQERAQRLFERYGVIPTYAVDYPVASQPEGYQPLREFLASGQCEIGSQLHPWVNPPIEEKICEANSFAGNLPARLERAKLRRLTMKIEETFGVRPLIYRAGRYSTGSDTAETLAELGYQMDCSILPVCDMRGKHGPDYRRFTADPHWFGPDGRLLEIPVTADVCGWLNGLGRYVYPAIAGKLGRSLKVPAICARLRMADRITLSPEGNTLAEAKRLTRAMLAHGHRVFSINYHSPSLEPGNTPYVRTTADLAAFLRWIEDYLAFFFGEVGGRPATPSQVRSRALDLSPSAEICAVSA